MNHQGQALLDLCIGANLRIMNGRCLGDFFGSYTCYTPGGFSVVDYLVASDEMFSHIH